MPENFFDRFDITSDADLTKPQGGMDRPHTRAELERAAPSVAPAGGNFFDRFDQGASTPAPAPTPAPTSIWDRLPSTAEVGRQLKMGVGHVVDGAGAALGFFANPVNTVANAVVPGDPFSTHVGEGWSQALGLPQPENPTERLVKDTAVAGAGGLFTAGAAEAGLAAAKAPSIARSFLQFLAEAPVVNTVAGASGGLSQGAAREAGYGEVGQTVAALAGGLAGGVAAARLGRPRAPGMPPEELIDGALDGEVLPPAPGLPSTLGRRPEFWGREPDPVIVDQPAIGAEPIRALPAPPLRIGGPDPRLPAPPAALDDLRGAASQPANSNRPAPTGRAPAIETPDVIVPAADPVDMANIGGAIERIRAIMSADPSERAALLTSTAPPRAPADVWSRIGARSDIANDLDLPAVPSRPLMLDTPPVVPPAAGIGSRSRMVDITRSTESGGRRYGADGGLLTSPKGARGEMQVMPGTQRDPGFGVVAARDGSPEELARVGRDYLAKMQERYQGDPAKAWAAYNAGPGALDRRIARYGDAWLEHMPAETQAYVAKNMKALGSDAPVVEGPRDTTPVVDGQPAVRDTQAPEVLPDPTVARAIDEMQPPVAPAAEVRQDAPHGAPLEHASTGRGEAGRIIPDEPLQIPEGPPALGVRDDGAGRVEVAGVNDPSQVPATSTPPAPPRPARAAATRVRQGPVDALTFIADRGGLRDDEGHALRARSRGQGGGSRDLPQFAPGGGHLFRKAGMSIDQAGEALHEAGYFQERPTTSEVLDLLDRSAVDRQYRPQDMPAIEDAKAARADEQWQAKTHDEIHAAASQYGDTVSADELASMRQLMADGHSAESAYIEHHDRIAAERAGVAHDATGADEFDIPGFEEPTLHGTDRASAETPRDADLQAQGADRGPESAGRAEAEPAAQPGQAATDRGGPAQTDAFGERRGDQRAALERRAEGRSRSDLTQKPPGSDGGLFDDNSGRQPDLLTYEPSDLGAGSSDLGTGAPKIDPAKMTPAEHARLIREGKWHGDGESGFITPDMLLAPFPAASS